MKVSIADIADRLSILVLKNARGLPCADELELYAVELWNTVLNRNGGYLVLRATFSLIEVNACIWELEAAIRAGRDAELSLEEIGKRALQIRDANRRRIQLKNDITDLSQTGYTELKINHASGD